MVEVKQQRGSAAGAPPCFAERPDLNSKEHLDTVGDLMHLDMGPLYRKIISTDMERRIYGFIPLMASCSSGQIGALNAESFCERVL